MDANTSPSCDEPSGFCGIGRWAGTAEVFDGKGVFLGNATDNRHIRSQEDDGRIKIDLAFVGPLKFSGHYYIREENHDRYYQGPVNCGHGEAFSKNLVSSNNFWPVTGLTHRFFLMILPDGNTQLSLSLMSRGEELIYSIVSENQKVIGESAAIPGLVNGISYDLQHDPKAGRQEVLLHKPGKWQGTLNCVDENLQDIGTKDFSETIVPDGDIVSTRREGGYYGIDSSQKAITMVTNQRQSYTQEGDIMGSMSLYGGRASAGTLHFMKDGLRLWRREVINNEGNQKAVVEMWFKGSQRVGAQFGALTFEAN